jgi:hypothetical protein
MSLMGACGNAACKQRFGFGHNTAVFGPCNNNNRHNPPHFLFLGVIYGNFVSCTHLQALKICHSVSIGA